MENNITLLTSLIKPLLCYVCFNREREKVYTQLSIEQASDYDTVNEIILKSYELVTEKKDKRMCNLLGQTNSYWIDSATAKRF